MQVSIRPPNQPEGTQLAEVTVKPGPLTLIADVEAGAADPQVEWNFDDRTAWGNLPPSMLQNPAAGGEFGVPGNPQGGGFPGAFPGQRGVPGQPGMMGQPGTMPGGVPVGGLPEGAVEILGPRVDARGLTASFAYPNEEQNYRDRSDRYRQERQERAGHRPPFWSKCAADFF